MSRNGSGGYSLLSNSWNPAVNGVSATAADWQALINDVAAAIQQSISADGQTPITGNLQMGGNKLTNLASGSGTGQSLRYEQLFSQGTLTDIASAATLDIGGQLSNFLRVTGTTGVTSFGTNYNGPRFLIFAGAVLLTHSATLVLPSAANITTAANDAMIAIPISGGWQVVAYQKATGVPIGAAVAGPLASSGITGAAASGANTDITSLGNNTSTVYTTAGTSTAYTITPNPAIAFYAVGQSFVVNFNAASGTSPTLQISGIATPPNLVKRSRDGSYVNIAANDIQINHRCRVTLISTTQALVEDLNPVASMVRLNTANGYGSTNNKIRRFTNIVTNQGADITYADSATLGASFTINTAGVYAISYSDHFSVSGAWNGLTLNTTTPTTAIFNCAVGEVLSAQSSGANNGAQSSWVGYLPSGSVIRAHTDGTSAGAIVAVQQFTIARVG